jgi:hypothetical protein
MITYRAVINIDFDINDNNEYERLKNALIQAGWFWVRTSAYIIETQDLAKVWRGIDLVARQATDIGQLSAVTFNVQGAEDFTTSQVPNTAPNHVQAQANVLQKPFPQP